MMNLKKRKSTIVGLVTALLLMCAGLFTGCTSNETNNNTNIHVSYPVLSSIDGAILEHAYEDYESLKQNLSSREARLQLLERLNNEIGVEKAELGLDNYTIFLTYSDGDFALVDTFELDEETPQEGIGFSPYSYGGTSDNEYLAEHTITFDGFSPELSEYDYTYQPYKTSYDIIIEGPGDRFTSESKKVLVLGPCYYEFDPEPIDQCIEQFKDHGWLDEDITLKLVKDDPWESNGDCLSLTPEDYFNLEDYGIIFFTGHGTVKVFTNFNEDNLYLQFCYLDNASFANNPQLKEWKDQGKLVIIRTNKCNEGGITKFIYTTGIRADLLREKVRTLPSSYLYFATCYGGHFNKVFLDHGAKIFVGWDDRVFSDIADTDMLKMTTLLLENSYSAYNAYSDSSITKFSWPDGDLFIYPGKNDSQNAYFLYYPAWIDLLVTSIPEGTNSITSSVHNMFGVLAAEAEDQVNFGATQIQCEGLKDILIPSSQEVTIQVTAYDNGDEAIATANMTTTLEAGENTLQIALAETGELSIEFQSPFETGQLDVRMDWPVEMVACFPNAPNGELLYVWDATGAETLGGFTDDKAQHYESPDLDVDFYSSGTGTDGTKIPITVSVYLIDGEKRQLLNTVSASIEVYMPMTQYSIVGEDDTSAFMTYAGPWEFYNVGHGMISSSNFYARHGDQIRITFLTRLSIPEWENPQVYLKSGETKTFLFNVDDIPDGGSFDQTFTVP